MRKEFTETIKRLAEEDSRIIFLTGDLGFMALEGVRQAIKDRFINVGVCEQNMISVAAGLASEGLLPVCYSIAPFAAFRPAEQIRLDVCLHGMTVKIVGNGGGYGYGIMGATHHAIEDIAVLSSFQGMRCFIPWCNEDVEETVVQMMRQPGPAYLRLGFGKKPEGVAMPPYNKIRLLARGDSLTVAGMGPVLMNVFEALKDTGPGGPAADVFAVSEMPLTELTPELTESVRKTGRLMVVEEHVRRGGLGENLALLFMQAGISCRLSHLFARGYPDGLYGSQAYHQKVSGLDAGSIRNEIEVLVR